MPSDALHHHFGFVIASKRITVDEARIGWMYRERSDDPADSGWRFYAGDEDDRYSSDPENFTLNAVTTILAIDSSVEPYLSAPPNSAFERSGPDWAFTPVDNFFDE